MAWTSISHRLSIRARIFGGFGFSSRYFLSRCHLVEGTGARRLRGGRLVRRFSGRGARGGFVSKAVEAQKSVLRYAVSENDADLAAAQKALSEFAEGARVLEEKSAGWKSGVSAVSSALEAATKYQAASADTIQTIAGRRTATSQFNKEITALRTIGSAIPAALLRENAAPRP